MTCSQKLAFWSVVIAVPAWAGLIWYGGWRVALTVYALLLANNLRLRAGMLR